jgi:hypothetical protein
MGSSFTFTLSRPTWLISFASSPYHMGRTGAACGPPPYPIAKPSRQYHALLTNAWYSAVFQQFA